MPNSKAAPAIDEADWIWGATRIDREIGRRPGQVYYLFARGDLSDTVWKMGSRQKPRELPLLGQAPVPPPQPPI
jgi:hypothetical protein